MLAIQQNNLDRAIEANARRSRGIHYRIARQHALEKSIQQIEEVIIERMKADQEVEGSQDDEETPSETPQPNATSEASEDGNEVPSSKEDLSRSKISGSFEQIFDGGTPVKPHEGFTPPGMERVKEEDINVPESLSERSKDNSA